MDPGSVNNTTNIVVPSRVRRRGVPDVPEDVDFLMEHLNDPNFDYYSELQSISDSGTQTFEPERKTAYDAGSIRLSEFDAQSRSESQRYSTTSKTDYDDESPYPEVRSAVSSFDDPTMPVSTFRAWLLGLLYVIVLSFLNELFSLRTSSVVFSGIIAQLTALPLGMGLARILPTTRFRTLGYTWTLNPGPFNIKEHVLITVMANVAATGVYSDNIILTQRFFYNEPFSRSYQLMLFLSTELIGYSLGGVLHHFLVYPSSMIWPGALVNCALFSTLHRTYGKPDHRHVSREKFFAIVIGCGILWYFVPGFLWTGLSVFNWVCWIAPNNVVVNTLFGTSTGLGMGILTFDWGVISYQSNPLVSPWWSEANVGVGFFVLAWLIAPLLYFTNSFYTSYLPMSSSSVFDNTGMPYNMSQVVTNNVFDNDKYKAYSPAFLPTMVVLAYSIAFASFTSIIVHTILWYRHDIMKRFKSNLRDERDVHCRLMKAYPEVPQWWYALLGITTAILLFVTVEVFSTKLPIWGVCLALFVAALMTIPAGMVQAITNQQVTLNVMYEIIAGYLLPGRPVAVMIFKGVASNATYQAVGFAGNMKLGHYMKIPPRLMFISQVFAGFVSSFAVALTQDFLFANIVDICQPHQPQFFTCPTSTAFATASLLWGGIGPQRMIGVGAMYRAVTWFFLVGAVLPIPFFYLARRFPLSYWRYINIPVMFAGLSALPPSAPINYSSWLVVAFFFQWFMRRYHFRWWMRYNYVLAAGLDAGVAFGMVIVFFTLQLPKGGINLNWWGNTVWQNTADALGTPLRVVSPGQIFGPSQW